MAFNVHSRRTDMRDRHEDNEAQLDDLGTDPGQVGPDSAGQSGDPQDLSPVEDASEESVEELADTDQAMEAEAVLGSEDAADHPERPVHTHDEYRRPEDVAPQRDENIEPDELKRSA
jgi:hypothetical protein